MRITTAWLEKKGACLDQLDTFAAEWPDGAEVSRENLLRASELKLNLNWLARMVFRAPARAEYKRAVVTALFSAWQMQGGML